MMAFHTTTERDGPEAKRSRRCYPLKMSKGSILRTLRTPI
jgi:hypothetical protein